MQHAGPVSLSRLGVGKKYVGEMLLGTRLLFSIQLRRIFRFLCCKGPESVRN